MIVIESRYLYSKLCYLWKTRNLYVPIAIKNFREIRTTGIAVTALHAPGAKYIIVHGATNELRLFRLRKWHRIQKILPLKIN
jgi:hypothetical protein